VRARRIVLCAGAIENARLLLLSDQIKPNGLGNDYDHVGRYLQDHPCGLAATVHTATPRRLQDHWNMLYGRGTRYLPKIALADRVQRDEGLLNCVGRLAYDYDEASGTRALLDMLTALRDRRAPPEAARRLAQIGRGLPDILESVWRVGAKGLSPAPRPRRIHLEVFSEQTPDPQSRITLDRATDAFGLRQVRIDWRLDALTGQTMQRFTRLVDREFRRLSLGRLQPAAWIDQASPDGTVPCGSEVLDSYHPAGTTRMAATPQQGVVDTDCQVFGVHGLYVAGSAVFPTSGAANPTLTIAAMALRLADVVKAAFARETVPRQTVQRRPLVQLG
jgi:choline dehydrogenase-like flavoprotein